MVSLGNDPPSSENTSSTEATYRDGKKEVKLNIDEKFGDGNYIDLYHIKLLAGRNLLPGDIKKAFLVNATYARAIGYKDPHDAVGKIIDDFNGDTKMQIIGVVDDFHQESLHSPIAPLVILTSPDVDFNGTFHIALKPQVTGSGDWESAIAAMQNDWKQLYPDDDFDYHFMDETIARLYEDEQRTSGLLSWATVLSVLISCLGLFGACYLHYGPAYQRNRGKEGAGRNSYANSGLAINRVDIAHFAGVHHNNACSVVGAK